MNPYHLIGLSPYERVMVRSVRRGACLVFPTKHPDDYGRVNLGDRRTGRAHRIVWEHHHGPAGALFVLHSCDTPPCVEIAHLSLGTNAENARQMAERRRSMWGERNPQAKLTDVQAAEIVARYRAGGVLMRELAAEYGITRPMVSLLVAGHRRAGGTGGR